VLVPCCRVINLVDVFSCRSDPRCPAPTGVSQFVFPKRVPRYLRGSAGASVFGWRLQCASTSCALRATGYLLGTVAVNVPSVWLPAM
jgi:hypothetical protein